MKNPFRFLTLRRKRTEEQTPRQEFLSASRDPLDVRTRISSQPYWPDEKPEKPDPFAVKVEDYPVYQESASLRGLAVVAADDSNVIQGTGQDNGAGEPSVKVNNLSAYQVPQALQDWYTSQGFIGHQACALIAQHWLVDKACSMAAHDAVRNGWELKREGKELDPKTAKLVRKLDKKFNIKANLAELTRYKNIFGIRVALFKVNSDDPDYYEKPFNIDGITKGSYQGISQVDPYWMTPQMTAASTSDPSAIHFYDPEYWIISGKKYHRSHLIICRGPQPADILKPTYVFGGIPLTQRIYERVYAAERTANEAPLLAMNKRTNALHVDLEKAISNESKFVERLLFWTKHRDNHGVKVLGKDEVMEQFDTSLADFDAVIMNQYQLVAAIAKTPATKLLGTSPKGFNATGEFEMVSYHEELESIQEHDYDPMLERHYLIAGRSLGLENFEVEVIWNSVDSVSATERANLNLTKAQTDEIYANLGATSPDEVRNRVRDDRHSGYNLSEELAEEEFGMTPENLAELEKSQAAETKAGAEVTQAENHGGSSPDGAATGGQGPTPDEDPATDVTPQEQAPAQSEQQNLLDDLRSKLDLLLDCFLPEGQDIEFNGAQSVRRSVEPSVKGANQSVAGINSKVPQMEPEDLWKIKMNGLVNVVENPRGSIRTGKSGNWQIKMPHHYGYIKGTKGADGDAVDCFIGPNLKAKDVYVVHQLKQDKTFDEHKCMLGFNSQEEAEKAYMDSYSEGWTGKGPVVKMSHNDFRKWVFGPNSDKSLVGGL